MTEKKNCDEVSSILEQTRQNGLEDNNLKAGENTSVHTVSFDAEGDEVEGLNEGLAHLEISSDNEGSVDTSNVHDDSSEQSWMLRSLSESSVACITSDYAMQNVILQMGLRLLAPGGMQLRQLHRYLFDKPLSFDY